MTWRKALNDRARKGYPFTVELTGEGVSTGPATIRDSYDLGQFFEEVGGSIGLHPRDESGIQAIFS